MTDEEYTARLGGLLTALPETPVAAEQRIRVPGVRKALR